MSGVVNGQNSRSHLLAFLKIEHLETGPTFFWTILRLHGFNKRRRKISFRTTLMHAMWHKHTHTLLHLWQNAFHVSDIVQLTENGKIVYIFSLPFRLNVVRAWMFTELNDHCYTHSSHKALNMNPLNWDCCCWIHNDSRKSSRSWRKGSSSSTTKQQQLKTAVSQEIKKEK